MNCPECGVELMEHVSFCPLCGRELPDDMWRRRPEAQRARKKPVQATAAEVQPRTGLPGRPPSAAGPQAPQAGPKKVTMRPSEGPGPAAARPAEQVLVAPGPKKVTMQPSEGPGPMPARPAEQAPVAAGPKKVTMRPSEGPGPMPARPAEQVPVAAGPKKVTMRPSEGLSQTGAEKAAVPAAAPPSTPQSGVTVDMLCPMCDAIVPVPVERPVRVSCPKCREEYYFTR